MIKINNTDSIVDIIQKIQEEESKEVILDFPFWHPILHNYLSLKILKNKAWNKPITIVTKDLTSRKIWKKLWINFSIIKDSNFIELSQNAKIINHNLSYWEYFKFEINRYSKLLLSYLTKNKKIDEFKKYSLKYYNKNWAWVFILILLLSIFIFFVVLFFAINKTYIYIKPEINIKPISYNYIFKDLWNINDVSSNWRIIKVKKVTKTLSLDDTFQTSWIFAWNSKKSNWEVTFYNTYTEKVSLKINSRIENKDWLIFETKTAINIPAWSIDSNWKIIPWIIKSEVTAKDYDINWRYIWTRWDKVKLKEKFSLPWLKWDDKSKIYAIASWKFSWWSDKYENILWENDIENAKNIFEDKLKKQALNEIKSNLDQENKTNNVTYEILSYDDIFKNAKVNIIVPNNIKVWDKIKNFKLTWTIDFFCYIYNKDSVINKLESIANERIIKEDKNINWDVVSEEVEKLLSIDKNSLRITNVIYEQTKPLEVKLTIEIDALMYKNFLNKNSAYVQRLKNWIYWLKKDDAEKILLNDKNIRSVDIEIQPFFMDKISNIENNVIFEIENTN